jgi:integrase
MKVQSGRFFDHKVLIGNTFAVELRQWRTMSGGRGFLFSSPTGNGDHITKESLSKAYKKTLGLTAHSVYGWRSSFSTLAKDLGGFDKVAVELTLDHVGDVKIVRTYDRGERLSERRRRAMIRPCCRSALQTRRLARHNRGTARVALQADVIVAASHRASASTPTLDSMAGR